MAREYKVSRTTNGRWIVRRDTIDASVLATRRLARAAARILSRLRAHDLQRVPCHVDRAKYIADLAKHADYVNRMYIIERESSRIERMKETEQ